MTMRTALVAAILGFAATGCATTGAGRSPTEVSRYHLGTPIAPGSVAIEPAAMTSMDADVRTAAPPTSPEFQLYADAVGAELGRLGFSPTGGGASQYLAVVGFQRMSHGQIRTPPRFSIGLGGGSFGGGRRGGGGVGLGGGVSTGFGSQTRDVLAGELAVQLKRRSDGVVVWEGRAQQQFLSGQPDAQPTATASRLAAALFKGFPGESGITISVR